MADFNKTILIGRLTQDPELKMTASSIPVTSFTIAINRKGKEKIADFLNIVAWRNTAEFVTKYFKKGQAILIVGSVQTRSYEDKDGKKRMVFEVVADEVQFAEPKRDGTPSTAGTTSYTNGDDFTPIGEDEELPF